MCRTFFSLFFSNPTLILNFKNLFMPRNFNEKTTDRVVATADDRSTAVIARTALRRVMTDSGSLYTKPYLLDWVQGKIDCFKDNLRREIVLKKGKLHRDKHFPELYAKMLREELEYIELCIEYNDKVKLTTDENGCFVEDNEPKIIGKIDLDDIE
jgi:hypothetical protein